MTAIESPSATPTIWPEQAIRNSEKIKAGIIKKELPLRVSNMFLSVVY
jgi:hypothetical protein